MLTWRKGKEGCSEYYSKCGRYRIYKSKSFWCLQDLMTCSDKGHPILNYCDTLREAKYWALVHAKREKHRGVEYEKH